MQTENLQSRQVILTLTRWLDLRDEHLSVCTVVTLYLVLHCECSSPSCLRPVVIPHTMDTKRRREAWAHPTHARHIIASFCAVVSLYIPDTKQVPHAWSCSLQLGLQRKEANIISTCNQQMNLCQHLFNTLVTHSWFIVAQI